MNKTNLAAFLTKMAEKQESASKATIEAIKAKLEKEAQEKIERQIEEVFRRIQEYVEAIRVLRRQEKVIKGRIAALEKDAERILQGKDE